MARKIASTLEDLNVRHSGRILLECAPCRRRRLYDLAEMRREFRRRGWRDGFDRIYRHFRCVFCGARPSGVYFYERGGAFDPPADAIDTCFAPFGIDPRSWALASPADRAKLIKARR